jgi:hypothetical protein
MWQYITENIGLYITAHQAGANMLDTYGIRQYVGGLLSKWLEDK